MCAIVALKESENELGAVETAIRTKCLRGRWRHTDQNARRYDIYDKITLSHEYPAKL